MRIKPSTVKGVYMLNISVSATMGPGIKIDGSTIA
jgi:large subunit ribosomal protein L1